MVLVVSMSRELQNNDGAANDLYSDQLKLNQNTTSFMGEEEVKPFNLKDEKRDYSSKNVQDNNKSTASSNDTVIPLKSDKEKTRGSAYKIQKRQTSSYVFPILNLNVHKIEQMDIEHAELMKRTKRLIQPMIWWIVVLLLMWGIMFLFAMFALVRIWPMGSLYMFIFFIGTFAALYKFISVLASVGDRYKKFLANLKGPNVCRLSNNLFNYPFYLANRFEDFQIQRKHTFEIFNNIINSHAIQRTLMSMVMMLIFTFAPGLVRQFFE